MIIKAACNFGDLVCEVFLRCGYRVRERYHSANRQKNRKKNESAHRIKIEKKTLRSLPQSSRILCKAIVEYLKFAIVIEQQRFQQCLGGNPIHGQSHTRHV